MEKRSCDTSSCFLCRFCSKDWHDLIALKKKNIFVKKGRTLFAEGERSTGIFFVYKGALKIHMNWGKEKELILRFAKRGEIVGHRGQLSEEVYPVTATALEDSVVCFISTEFWNTTLRTHTMLTYHLMLFYSQELQDAEKRMHDLAHMPVKGRIAGALLELIRAYGLKKNNTIAVTVYQQDIASYAGTIYETVFKFFRELKLAKIIRTSGKQIKILQEDKLRSFIK
jgi:CRP-like cAMP-binding protein